MKGQRVFIATATRENWMQFYGGKFGALQYRGQYCKENIVPDKFNIMVTCGRLFIKLTLKIRTTQSWSVA